MKKFNIKTSFFTLIVLAIVMVVSLTSCVTLTGKQTTTPAITATTTVPQVSETTAPPSTTWQPVTSDSQVVGQLNSIADVVELVKPAVVSINTQVTSYDFFNRAYTQEGAGSGWIIDPDGVIVTNNHVVEGAKSITVITDNGNTYTADPKKVYTDSVNDLAIIKIDTSGLPFLKVGDNSKMRLGDWVIAVGNALGQGTRVTEGIISRLNVSLDLDQNDTLYNLIETTAAINPGNSGGPLVNMAGEVIGITSAKISSIGVEGMGYAISMETASPIIKELVNNGFVVRPFLGVSLYTVDSLAINEFDLKIDKGVLILDVSAGGPADKAGLKAGDVVVSLGGKEITSVQDFTQLLRSAVIGQPLDIKYYRGSNVISATVTPAAAPRIQN